MYVFCLRELSKLESWPGAEARSALLPLLAMLQLLLKDWRRNGGSFHQQ